MNLETYRLRRQARDSEQPQFRDLCTTCFQPSFGCYCASLRPFDPGLKFVILIHPVEKRRRIATGRMSHLSLQGSRMIVGKDFSQNAEVDAIVRDPSLYPVLLYPGPTSTNLTPLGKAERAEIFPDGREPVIFVIDGTWASARPMVRSQNLRFLPRICFAPPSPSRFRVRKQPAAGCYSTIEAIHHTLELLGDTQGLDIASRKHDALLDVFDVMVERQLKCVETIRSNRQSRYRRELAAKA